MYKITNYKKNSDGILMNNAKDNSFYRVVKSNTIVCHIGDIIYKNSSCFTNFTNQCGYTSTDFDFYVEEIDVELKVLS